MLIGERLAGGIAEDGGHHQMVREHLLGTGVEPHAEHDAGEVRDLTSQRDIRPTFQCDHYRSRSERANLVRRKLPCVTKASASWLRTAASTRSAEAYRMSSCSRSRCVGLWLANRWVSRKRSSTARKLRSVVGR